MNLALIQTHNYSQVEICNFYQVNRQWLHVPSEQKSKFHIISLWHTNDCIQLGEIKARRWGTLGPNINCQSYCKFVFHVARTTNGDQLFYFIFMFSHDFQ
jgi:hypothetical protein